MVKILCIGDPHFKTSNARDTTEMHQEIKLLLENNYVACVVLGDILDTFERINLDCYKRAIDFLHDIHQKTKLILLIGNHDRVNNQEYQTERHMFGPLEKWENTFIVWKTTDVKIENFKFLCVPYVPTGKFKEAIQDFNIQDYDLVFAHQEFKGAKLGRIISENGDEYSLDYPTCISGHIHDYDVLQENLIYSGTPYQLSFNDTPNKYVLEVNFNPELRIKKKKLNLTKKIQLKLTLDELQEFIPDEDKIYNLTLLGNSKDLKMCTNTFLSQDNVNLKVKPYEEEMVQITDKDFMTLLRQIIQPEPQLIKLLNKILK